MTHRARAGWLAVAMAVACGVLPARAQQAALVGTVEMEKVFAQSTFFKQKAEEFRELNRKLNAEIEVRRTNYPLLVDEEYNKLVELRNKTKLTPEEQKQFDALQRYSNERDGELAKLEGLEDNKITAEQRARRQLLMNMRAQAQEQIAAMAEKHRAALAKQDEEMSREVKLKVEEAAKQVATEMKLMAVLQADAVLFGGVDVTDKVIEKLNATK